MEAEEMFKDFFHRPISFLINWEIIEIIVEYRSPRNLLFRQLKNINSCQRVQSTIF